jgi:uncharacterized membrane protein
MTCSADRWFCFCCCSAILLPIVVTFYVTYHFLQLFDGIFSVSTAGPAGKGGLLPLHDTPSLLAVVSYPARIGLVGSIPVVCLAIMLT